MRGVSPAEGHRTIGESKEPAVGDADAVGVSTEVAEDVLWSAEWTLRIDDPIVTEQASEPSSEAAWLGQRCEMAVEMEVAIVERSLQPCEELAAEDAAEHLDGKDDRREAIQLAWSGARPPAAITQWTCGWCWRRWSQVWSTLKKPISAPRCRGSRATCCNVAALAWKRRL